MDKTRLQQLLSRLDPVDDPDAELEQYATPPDIAADVLHRMRLDGALDGQVVDLGCGNGIFTIGAALLGADAVGIDVDGDAVATARANLERVSDAVTDAGGGAEFAVDDVRDAGIDADAAVTNPPFGLQRSDANLAVLEAAFDAAPVVYALLHRAEEPGETRAFLERFAAEHGFDAAVVAGYDFPLPRRFAHHAQEKKYIKVDLYRFTRDDGR
ncbi:MAG: METTL5 family protein [Candidatus Nanohaloarchaea archaeon]|nr:METTL5 family protein [Candidatus Nanohaloarchaea archaeon]